MYDMPSVDSFLLMCANKEAISHTTLTVAANISITTMANADRISAHKKRSKNHNNE